MTPTAPRRTACSLVLGTLVFASAAVQAQQPVTRSTSEAPRRYAHLLTEALVSRLRPPAQRNRLALVKYDGERARGSGVLVRRWSGAGGEEHALLLTANHVLDLKRDKLRTLTLADGSQVASARLVARNRFLDYALLEIDLPPTAAVGHTHASPHMPSEGSPIYSLGAATSMTSYPVEAFLPGGPRRDALARDIATGVVHQHPTISSGQITARGPTVLRVSNKRSAILFGDYASAPGASGGPVFDASTHELVGINVIGRVVGGQKSGLSPMALIGNDLGKQWARGLIPQRSVEAVRALLGEIYPHLETASEPPPGPQASP